MSEELANAHKTGWLLFGATGVTGRLILKAALSRGHRPVLAGRNLAALQALAGPHGLDTVQASAEDRLALGRALSGHRLVLNAAGPFAVTASPLMEAALAAGIDYIDVNGELGPLQQLLQLDAKARARGTVLVGGAGFGVAATDGLAAQVSERLGGAKRLRIAVAADSAFASPAVAESTLAVLAGGGYEIEGLVLARSRLGRLRWRERLQDGGKLAFASAPLADLVAAARVTGAAEVVAGVPMPAAQARVLATLSPIIPSLLKAGPIRRLMARIGGHSGAARENGTFTSRVWVEGERDGRRVLGRLEAGEGFALAAELAVLAVEALAAARPLPGAYTPARAFGAKFIEKASGVRITFD